MEDDRAPESAAAEAVDHRMDTSSTPPPYLNGHAIASGQNGTASSPTTAQHIKQESGEQHNADTSTTTTLRPNPEPSIKRRESQAASETPEGIAKLNIKKRKRGTSPPWQFPTADKTSFTSVDGRRISARFSTNAPTPIASETESRARSSSLSAPPRSSRAPSPPWKKFEAKGPSSLTVDGLRKSGRVNKELTAEDPPKRVSPRGKKLAEPMRSHANDKVMSSEKTHVRTGSGSTPKKDGKQPRREPSPSDHRAKIAELQAKLDALQPTRSFPAEGQLTPSQKRKRSDGAKQSPLDGRDSSSAHRKMSHQSRGVQLPAATNKPTPRLKLRFNAQRHNIPPPHPNARLPSPVRPPGLSIHQLLDNVDLREMQQPYMENERGPPDLAWFKHRAVRQAEEEATIRRKILEAAGPGGVLSREECSVYREEAESQSEPPKVYTHIDHLINHVQNFRHLQVRETKEHKQLARKIANEALEYWKKKRGPTEEDIRAEEDRIFKLIYKQVVLDIKAKWQLVAQHVDGKRLQAWDAEQEVKRQERLQEKLAKSQSMVARQRRVLGEDSAGDSNESEDELSDERRSEENVSASQSEDEDEDAGKAEDRGHVDEAAMEAYIARRKQELLDQDAEDDLDDHGDGDGDDAENEDVSMTNYQETSSGNTEPESDSSPRPAATLADFFCERLDERESEMGSEKDSEKDFQPAGLESQPEGDDGDDGIRPTTGLQFSARRSRRSSAAVDVDDVSGLSNDTSTDMDSDDSDDNDDTSSKNDEANDDSKSNSDADDEDDEDEEDEEAGGASTLAFYKLSSKDTKLTSLPTPTTSAEGDNSYADVQANSDSIADTEAGAEADEYRDADAVLNALSPKGDEHASRAVTPALLHVTKLDEACDTEVMHNAPPVCSPNDEVKPIRDAIMEPVEAAEAEVDESAAAIPLAEDNGEAVGRRLAPQPSLLRGQLRSYQHAGLDWLASLYRNGTNGILADEMGLGKTIQTIALLAHLAEEYGCWETHLVIVPTSVVLNWVTEFQKFLPGFRVLAYYGTSEERQAKRKGWVNDPHLDDKSKRGYNVVITSYNTAMQDINALRGVQWHYLVLDEAHNIRNFNSQRWQILIRLKTHARLLLTGTPLQNSLTELWSLLTFLTAGDDDPAHGDLEEFLSHWRDPVREIFDAGVQTLSPDAQKVVDQLHISLRPFLLRRLKSEVEKDLPKKTESVVVCKLSKRQRQLYQEYMGLAEVKKSLAQGNAVSAGKVLLSLRRVCNHPDLFDPRGVESSWGMERSIAEDFGMKQAVVRRLLGEKMDTPSIFVVVAHEAKGRYALKRARQLDAKAKLLAELTVMESSQQQDAVVDTSTLDGGRALRRARVRQHQLCQLRAAIRYSDGNSAASPIYGSDLQELLTIKHDRAYKVKVQSPPVSQPFGHAATRAPQSIVQSLRGWPQLGSRPLRLGSEHPSDWLIAKDSMLQRSAQTYSGIGEKLHGTLTRFAFVTPAVTAPVLDYLIPTRTQYGLRASSAYPRESDYAHEARVRLSIAFPDSRLLVYDSGKLQRLTYLLRDLQAKGSRSLIFTQMTGTLNILEQFLSLMGLPYLRLDGSTSPERRHLYAQEFNRPDSKYQCMILSSRAGGVGLNLTGASSVIFYDLDWNPQMDRQCMDRAHRIGQVRDVEVYKMVSEKTVEENILRRAEQKSLLDQTVIQEGHFTTDYEIDSGKDDKEEAAEGEEDVAAAIERFLGSGNDKSTAQALESVEDREDVAAAQRAHKEEHQDEADFGASSNQHSGRATPAVGLDEAEGVDTKGHVDGYMVQLWEWSVEHVPFQPPMKKKEGRDRKRKR